MSADPVVRQRKSSLMNVTEVADLFDVHPKTVRIWVRDGKLTASRTPGGRDFRFLRAYVEALADSPRNENGPVLATATPDEP
ncbi:helix-turn-helix domain-containing protein [Streptosporangium sp. NPDC001559]|uniref:helix-turn-helix domain-containing protein n=1 Tax=Streptosporangium sp. NPDC001559 TaxID=3366187 RepID=UPI0036E145E9